MRESLLLQAFAGTNKTVPVWFMRQAGRYLPQYQMLRRQHALSEMFTTPGIAAEITCLPVQVLGVDAAILFADILTLPAAMGFQIDFTKGNGPHIENPITHASDIDNIHDFEELDHITKIILLVNKKLPAHIPLIGFAGSPFTVLCYLLEGRSTLDFSRILHFVMNEPGSFHRAMEILTVNTINYLRLQQQAGIKVFQLFDTWGGILRPADYAHLVLPYVQRIFESVELPSVYYMKNSLHLIPLMCQSGTDFLSLCHTVVLGHSSLLDKANLGVQGNLFNGLLYADNDTLSREANDVLVGAKKHYKKYIFNLSHGVLPDVEVKKLKMVVDLVHKFPWKDE